MNATAFARIRWLVVIITMGSVSVWSADNPPPPVQSSAQLAEDRAYRAASCAQG